MFRAFIAIASLTIIRNRGTLIIEHNVWIGTGAIILPGMLMGTGSIGGAGSVVPEDVPARAVAAAGVPTRVIGEK